MKRVAIYGGVALALFLALAATERLTNGDPFSMAEFSGDLFEMALLALAVVATTYSAQELREARIDRKDLLGALAAARDDGEKWRATARVHVDGLASAIRQQFATWELTPGESDVAILMLKGLSHKEIAQIRNSSAATVRQQAASVYGKCGLANRAELAAYFLEDLLPSATDRSADSQPTLTLVETAEPSRGHSRHLS
jgi:DNA-binding CsgD family transcriptional regulator